MNTVLAPVVLLTFLLAANASFVKDDELIDYRLAVSRKQISPFLGKDDCTKNRVVVCQDCTSIGLCIADGNGWKVIDGGKCGEGETCRKGVCTKDVNPSCASNLDFICTSTGMFPNQEDCKRYHFCVKDAFDNKLTAFNDVCADNYDYNFKTTYCSEWTSTGECTHYPIPLCNKLGEIAHIPNNPVLYYVCIRRTIPGNNVDVLYPVIYACEHGRSFDKNMKRCNSQ